MCFRILTLHEPVTIHTFTRFSLPLYEDRSGSAILFSYGAKRRGVFVLINLLYHRFLPVSTWALHSLQCFHHLWLPGFMSLSYFYSDKHRVTDGIRTHDFILRRDALFRWVTATNHLFHYSILSNINTAICHFKAFPRSSLTGTSNFVLKLLELRLLLNQYTI